MRTGVGAQGPETSCQGMTEKGKNARKPPTSIEYPASSIQYRVSSIEYPATNNAKQTQFTECPNERK